MDNTFDIFINYKSKEISFPAELISTGYRYKINVDIYGETISFEPDEEGSLRAVAVGDDRIRAAEKMDMALIQTIAEKLVSLFADEGKLPA
jgi:hypothetical protein